MNSRVRRIVDLALTIPVIVALAPLYVIVAIVIKVSDRGPVLFRQERIGKSGRPFFLLKFRSMRQNSQSVQVTAGDDERITRVGRLLRRTKIDELPELWNIVRGEMALVGPRPEVPRYVDMQDPLWQEALEYPPGVTDPATLRLRNEEELLLKILGDRESFYRESLLPWKLRAYAAYGRRRTLWTDILVLVKTILAVVWPASCRPTPELLHELHLARRRE